ncbi:MAG: transketolase [Candidatus Sungbacteria bacterium RIFCSPLOWO2_02_FULL_51_17]|uniref:Transketolase n=1 Tax=Candidatus Sungbacteria bacterium RIFCSPHIGHO2_02_FULL_51_29 TaxID=1802273 RepID=A0A1G2KWZ5_9BACT|nr:MAG: transketolase [Candidatus Sungbacteria bacterium RIFCSPHIGHO2_01_FULL_51_22]OHA03975.1 MAG: transketolase [Candidatus Sungbacteria bacterium RIFCSPHIGHO2_02_FULL_51_29]OHA12451.1 MAG: transketolase [Candidatus Sungbacteria bacterium RIFCSPLOWO2_02_FULL_51_17]
MHLHDDKVKFLEEKANAIRQSIIEMLLAAGSGHTAGPLGMADIFTALYFQVLKHDPKNPEWEERDRLVLSNGHICPVQYATMAHAGYFPVEELLTLRKFGTRLQGHPHRTALPGIEVTSGPLGSGLGQAVGMALALKMDKKMNQVYCLMGDGEQDCGIVWEALMLAGKHHLDNLTVVIDRNNIQIDGMTEDIMPLEPMRAKYEAFNWHVLDVNAHDFIAINNAFEEARGIYEKPVVLIAHTIPGRGIPEIEFDYTWHGIPPKAEEGKHFLDILRTLDGKIRSEHQ